MTHQLMITAIINNFVVHIVPKKFTSVETVTKSLTIYFFGLDNIFNTFIVITLVSLANNVIL